MNKIALLVIGANSPEILARMVEISSERGFAFYVHIDRKVDLESYKSRMGLTHEKVIFSSQRHSVYWGGFNMIEATMTLIHAAADRGHQEFALISDDAFFLEHPDAVYAALTAHPNRIDLWSIAAPNSRYVRYSEIFHFDGQAFSARWLPAEERTIDVEEIRAVYEDMVILRDVGKSKVPIFMGSQWWSLGEQPIREIIRVWKEDSNLVRSFKYSAIPDEMFFHSIVAKLIPERVPCPMLVDFSREPKPFVFATLQDIEGLNAKDKYFIRKVRPGSEIVDRFG